MVTNRLQYKILKKLCLFKRMISRVEAANDLKKLSNIQTHMTDEEKVSLFWLIKNRRNQVKRLVEIGSYLGASSCYISAGLSDDARLICVDTWGNHAMTYDSGDVARDGLERDTFRDFSRNTEPFKNKIVPVRGWSSESFDAVKKSCETSPVDFLFIDGDHSYEGVKLDWETYRVLLKPGSLVAFHDTGWAEGVQRLIAESVKPISKPILWLPNLEVYQLK